MKTLNPLACYLFFILFTFWGSHLFAKDFELAIGETLVLPTIPLETIRIQKKGILSLKDRGEEIVFTAKKLGQTTVKIGKTDYKIRVLKKDRSQTLNQLKQWIANKRGPSLKIFDQDIQVHGRLLRLSDFIDLIQFTDSHSQFSLATETSVTLQIEMKNYVTSLLNQNNLPMGEISFSPFLQIRLSDQLKVNKSRYQSLLNPYGIQIVFDEKNLTQAPVIKIQVYIAHVTKSFMRQWGVSWPSEVSTNIIKGEPLKIEAFNISLKALESSGEGTLLATPTLITESNKMAEFHSGGEFPIRTTSQFNNNVQWKPYGLFLKATPTTNAQKHLKISIDLELSTLDQSLNTDGTPSLIRSQVKTQVNMKSPAPILLSGFLRQDQGESRSGLPWLKQIPLFEPLFSTGAIYNNELELVFILVPSFYEQ